MLCARGHTKRGDSSPSLREDPRTSQIPVVMLTARGDEIDRVIGFEVGADDYVEKPFDLDELVARMKMVARRVYAQA